LPGPRPPSRRIVVLVHRDDDLDGIGYFVKTLATRWQELGIETCFARGPAELVPADAAMVHLDRTRVPNDYRRHLARYPVVINGAALNIAKRRISRQQVSRWRGSSGPIIVKTSRNFGGRPELLHARAQRSWWRRRLGAAVAHGWSAGLDPASYPVFARVAAVPWRWRWHPGVILDEFLPERPEELFCLRQWTFFGDRETGSIAYSTSPTIKAETIVRREPSAFVPDALRAIRRELGFDYGKFDWALVDERPVLFDANRTPTIAGGIRAHHTDIADHLAGGVLSLLGC
jgi:hypothetical protein